MPLNVLVIKIFNSWSMELNILEEITTIIQVIRRKWIKSEINELERNQIIEMLNN